jgi:hypothetical protein
VQRVQAIVQAATLNGQETAGTMSDRTLIRLLLRALNVDNADALLDEILPEGADYFDTEPQQENADPGIAALLQEPPTPLDEADPATPPKLPKPKGESDTPPRAGDGEDNPNVDDRGVGMDKSGLHKVAPPPPSMRNQGSAPNPMNRNPFGENSGGNPQLPTGRKLEDPGSQKRKRAPMDGGAPSGKLARQ